jgi:hypothetical protein
MRRLEEMTKSFRAWWRNCALEADSEIQDIDRLAERWVENIIETIGAGDTQNW